MASADSDASANPVQQGEHTGRRRRPTRGRRDWRELLAAALSGTAGGLAVNAASNHIQDWAALAVAVVALLFAAAWIREFPSTSRLAAIASWTSVGLASAAGLVATFGPPERRTYSVLVLVLLAIFATLIPQDAERALKTLLGVAVLGGGVASLGGSMAILSGHAAVLGGGAATLLDRHQVLAGAACLGGSAAVIGGGAAILLEYKPLGGTAVIGFGVATLSFGVADLLDGHTLDAVCVFGFGVAALVGSVAVFLDNHRLLRGLAILGVGVSALGIGVENLLKNNTMDSLTFFGGGVAALGLGLALLLDHRTLFGLTFLGCGIAAVGLGLVDLLHHEILLGVATLGAAGAALGLGLSRLPREAMIDPMRRGRQWLVQDRTPRQLDPANRGGDEDRTGA